MKTNELSGALLDYWTARAEGYRFYHEARGLRDAYTACVFQRPGNREPWMSTQNWKAAKERYAEVFTFADLKIGFHGMGVPCYSSDWGQGGPIIERERIATCPFDGADRCDQWIAHVGIVQNTAHFGETALVAAMRAYVASKFGHEVPDNHEAALAATK